ncbi:dTMP kinase [Balnearium lithotrophicum]|uniref:Thymidylate kinase n=1 Tax=Balnearium lithotrophicum TaxID=223788 RepID=A0A521CVB3_9BACT|nr:dTMP kinase [Balnearium lithotrophicum]SMO63399.1 dTMP kinase [Balnearium lithotrophicum]
MFITFEGIEGCGKSTQSKLLFEELIDRGFSVVLTREPGGTEASEEIRRIILKKWEERFTPFAELSLYEAARSLHVENLIRPSLNEGAVVICDRFTDSTVAYQGYGRGLSLELIERLNLEATGGLRPDLTFLLDLPVEAAFKRLERKSLDRMESEERSFHERVREGFLEIAEREKERVVVLDGTQDVEEIFNHVLRIVLERLNAL